MLVIVVLALAAPLLTPYDPLESDVTARLVGPSSEHLLGTDVLGRDVFSRLFMGARTSLASIVIAVAVAAAFAIPWGLLAGYLGGIWDEVLMRLADGFIAFPGLVLALAIAGVVGPSLGTTMATVGFVFAPTAARLLRTAVLPLPNADYVLVSRSVGTSASRAALRHILPNAMAPLVVQLCALGSLALLIEASMSFLGLGVQPPAPSWGADLSLAYQQFTSAPLLTVAPGLLITLLAFLLTQIGAGLRVLLRTE